MILIASGPMYDESEEDKGLNMVVINAEIVEESGKDVSYSEGCLSIPDITGDVERPETIVMTWMDENFEPHEATFTDMNARVIQHEYDHIEGILFTERLKPLKKRLVKRRLEKIRKGEVDSDYRMKFIK